MAQTFKRVCIEDYTVEDVESLESFTLKRAQEYTTSPERDGQVTVYSTYWVRVPVTIFAGAVQFTPPPPEPCPACGGKGHVVDAKG